MAFKGEALIHNYDDGRDYLQGRPVHCGDSLKLWVWATGAWVWARYEMYSDTRRGYLVGPGDRIVQVNGAERVRWPEEWEC